jgi:thiol-disulfide isomerase/thioredoxin
MRKLLFIVFLIIPFFLSANNFILKGKVHAWNNQHIYLFSSYGDKFTLIDSVMTSPFGQFSFELKNNLPKGLYRLRFTGKKYIEVILNHENIDLSTHISDPFKHLTFNESNENKIYLNYLQKRNYDQYRIELLHSVLSRYPLDDPFYSVILQKFTNIQNSLELYINHITNTEVNTYAAKLIELDRRPKLDPMLSQEKQKQFAREHFFDNKRFNDTSLLYSNAITNNLLSYLSLFQNNKMKKDEIEEVFTKAVDNILSAMRPNKIIYEFVTDYLIGGFEQYGFSKVITHIASQIEEEESCENDNLRHRLKALKKMAPGNKAPEINIGNTKLYSIEKKKTLVIFYASWCPLCKEILPTIHDIYLERKQDMEVLAISIDTSGTEYNNYLKEFNYSWISECDFKGWETQSVLDYGVYVTPNLFLLDKKKKIIGRPVDIIELQLLLNKE